MFSAHRSAVVAFVLSSLTIAGCGRAGGGTAALSAASAGRLAETAFQIRVPSKKSSSAGRAPAYVSPATQSIEITATPSAGAPVSVHQDLTPASGNCRASNPVGYLDCTIVLSLAPGSYTADFATYDATGGASGGGNLLAQTKGYPFTVAPGVANTVSATLGGIPASVLITPAPNQIHVTGAQTGGYAIIGARPQRFLIFALDADQNAIIGPGLPSLTVTTSDGGTNLNVAPVPGNPNAYSVRVVRYSATPLTLSVSAQPVAGSGIVTPTTATVPLSTVQEFWIAESHPDVVSAWAVRNGVATEIPGDEITNGLHQPMGIAFDSTGRLWVANFTGGDATAYRPGNDTPIATISGLLNPRAFAFDASGALWIANQNAPGDSAGMVTAYDISGASPVPLPSKTIVGAAAQLDQPAGIAFDASGTLWVSNIRGSKVTAYAAGTTTPISADTIALPANSYPNELAFDTSGTLWVTRSNSGTIQGYVPGTTTPTSVRSVTSNSPRGLAFDTDGNLWTTTSTDVEAFAPGAAGPTTAATFSLGFSMFGQRYGAGIVWTP
ncbi:MAG: repeat containing protein [Candidatus Eremiobacteraeota bacterium]|nr:repeat containing protein [Candidatus Eremiobacteraeota bacterium]